MFNHSQPHSAAFRDTSAAETITQSAQQLGLSPHRGAVKVTGWAESCVPPAGLPLPPPPPLPPSRGETGSAPESAASLDGTTGTIESETGILKRERTQPS